MQSVFIVDFMSILTQKSTTCTFVCQVVKHITDSETSFPVLGALHWWADASRQKHQLIVHSKVLCLTVSNPGKMWHGYSLMGSHWHILQSTQNLLARSACSCHRSGPPKHHHCLPETLLPEILVCESSVILIWIYIYIYTGRFRRNLRDFGKW